MTYQADQSNNITLKDIIPEKLDNNLIDSLVGYETISAYNQSLRLAPFSRLDNKEFKNYGNQAIDTIDYWMKNVETPFGNVFLSIKSVFIDEDDTVSDFTRAIYNLCDNPGNMDSKNLAKDAIEHYIEVVGDNQTSIKNTNEYVDEFRTKLAADSINFKIIEDKLPALQGQYKKDIEEKQKSLETVQKEIDRLTVLIRKKILEIQDIDEDIGKAGICCAIPIINWGGAIAMASFLSKRSSANKELTRLQNELENNRKKYKSINSELYQLNEQLPLLATMSKQVPSLFKLSQNSAEVAQAIKRAWDDISFNLTNFKKSVEQFNTIEQFSSYKKRKIKENFDKNKKAIQQVLDQHKRSKSLGLPYDDEAKRVFKARSNTPIGYVDIKYKKEGLFYFPYKSLASLT